MRRTGRERMTDQTHFDDPRWDAEQESLESFTDEDTEEDTDG
jgi:hypothetical protein